MNHRRWIGICLLTGIVSCVPQTQSSLEDLARDSSVSLCVSNIHGDVTFFSILIVCKDGHVSYSYDDAGPYRNGERPVDTTIGLADYYRLWRRLEKQEIWKLKHGEFWEQKETLKQGKLPSELSKSVREKFLQEYWQDELAVDGHGSYSVVEVRVGSRRTGFARAQLRALRDQRYFEVLEAIHRAKDIRDFIREGTTSTETRGTQ